MGRLRIGLDAHYLAKHEGNRSYVAGLLKGLATVPEAAGVEVVAYSHDPQAHSRTYPQAAHRWIPRTAWLRVPVAVPLVQALDRLDLWHGSWVAPPRSLTPFVLTIHDVLFATRPELFSRAQGLRLRWTVGSALRRARRILVPSQATRAALRQAYPWVDPAAVDLVPLGVDPEVYTDRPRRDDGARLGALRLPRPFVLAVGRPDRRKNLSMLMAACGQAGLPLVLAGPHRGAEPHLRSEAGRLGLPADALRVVADPPDQTLAALYRACGAFAFPSRGEGFGLPALEAMACGAPVLTSTDPALVELTDQPDQALDPDDQEGWATALAALLADPDEARAAARPGLERARKWTLEVMARGTLATYRRAVGEDSATGSLPPDEC